MVQMGYGPGLLFQWLIGFPVGDRSALRRSLKTMPNLKNCTLIFAHWEQCSFEISRTMRVTAVGRPVPAGR